MNRRQFAKRLFATLGLGAAPGPMLDLIQADPPQKAVQRQPVRMITIPTARMAGRRAALCTHRFGQDGCGSQSVMPCLKTFSSCSARETFAGVPALLDHRPEGGA